MFELWYEILHQTYDMLSTKMQALKLSFLSTNLFTTFLVISQPNAKGKRKKKLPQPTYSAESDYHFGFITSAQKVSIESCSNGRKLLKNWLEKCCFNRFI